MQKLVNERCGIESNECAMGATASCAYELEGDCQLLKKNLFLSMQLLNLCKFYIQRTVQRDVFL